MTIEEMLRHIDDWRDFKKRHPDAEGGVNVPEAFMRDLCLRIQALETIIQVLQKGRG